MAAWQMASAAASMSAWRGNENDRRRDGGVVKQAW